MKRHEARNVARLIRSETPAQILASPDRPGPRGWGVRVQLVGIYDEGGIERLIRISPHRTIYGCGAGQYRTDMAYVDPGPYSGRGWRERLAAAVVRLVEKHLEDEADG